jgi:hypothetical protein
MLLSVKRQSQNKISKEGVLDDNKDKNQISGLGCLDWLLIIGTSFPFT